MPLTKQQHRVVCVLATMQRMAQTDESYAELFADLLEEGLTSLHDNDAFGTEGQSDPRGDFRNGHWSMACVEHVDTP